MIVDYKKMLIAYMAIVVDAEGCTYLPNDTGGGRFQYPLLQTLNEDERRVLFEMYDDVTQLMRTVK